MKEQIQEEYKIIEDEEDIMMRKLGNALRDMVERAEKEEKRERELGPLCGVISDLQFIEDQMGNKAMFFRQPTQNYAVNFEVQTTVVYANHNGQFDKEFSYPSFQGAMMLQLLNKGARSYNVDNMGDVYKFLKSDIENGLHNKPNLDILFRMNERSRTVCVYADVKLGKTVLKESIAFNHLPLYCKALNDSIQKKDNTFGGDDK